MGGNVQEVFQGRGDKEGKGFLTRKVLPLLVLFVVWLGLAEEFPLKFPSLWFSFGAAASAVFAALHFAGRRRKYALEFLLSLALVFAGVIQSTKIVWLWLGYFPFVISAGAFYAPAVVMPLSVLVPLLGVKPSLDRQGLMAEAFFAFFLIATSLASALIVSRLRKERDRALSSLKEIGDNARQITRETGMESLGSEEVMSHYFASMLKTDEEVGELLLTIKQAVFADSASLFVPGDGGYSLRCSTEADKGVIVTGAGVIAECMTGKKTFLSGELNEKGDNMGYIKNMKVLSLVAVPVMDGSTPAGVLAVDSSRYQAFSEADRNTVEMFAGHILRILERERVYLMIKRDTFGLKILKEESSNLILSLNADVIAGKLIEGAAKVVSSRTLLFLTHGEKFRLMGRGDDKMASGEVFDFKGTLIDMAVRNRQHLYISDVADYRVPVLPFRSAEVRSLLVIPMLYERGLIGLFVMLSARKDFLDTFQVDLLRVMCNQASTSLANAKLHAEIEKMATTDGLTGLFNHRLFQEKLSVEFRRMKRFSKPLSLLLADIDYFKKVNDTYGHPAGDHVLKGVSKTIRETIRDIDVAARYGGEEFAVILPGTDEEGAKTIAERLRRAVAEMTFSPDGRSLKVTVSIGIGSAPADARSKEELIEKTDQALYHAKGGGRNRCVSWKGVK